MSRVKKNAPCREFSFRNPVLFEIKQKEDTDQEEMTPLFGFATINSYANITGGFGGVSLHKEEASQLPT